MRLQYVVKTNWKTTPTTAILHTYIIKSSLKDHLPHSLLRFIGVDFHGASIFEHVQLSQLGCGFWGALEVGDPVVDRPREHRQSIGLQMTPYLQPERMLRNLLRHRFLGWKFIMSFYYGSLNCFLFFVLDSGQCVGGMFLLATCVDDMTRWELGTIQMRNGVRSRTSLIPFRIFRRRVSFVSHSLRSLIKVTHVRFLFEITTRVLDNKPLKKRSNS